MRGLAAKPGRRHIVGDDRRRTHPDRVRRTGGAGKAPVESDHHVGSRTGGDRTGLPTGKARVRPRKTRSRKYGTMKPMKTTLEIPDALFRQAKTVAAQKGIPLRELVTEALTDKLRTKQEVDKPWMSSFGGLSHLREETRRINQIIRDEFETIEPEDRL